MSLEQLRLTPAAFLALPEYSATVPTGVVPGKRWRRLNGAHDLAWRRRGGKPRWLIGEYQNIDDKRCRIVWYEPIISMRAAT